LIKAKDDVTVLMFRANSEALPLPDLSLANLGGAIFGPLNRLWK
jgi:hypothetical protein